jgi:hypothetical protein
MSVVLGLHGAALSGKDTVADFLIQERGWDRRLSFARNLKDMCKSIFILSEYDVNDQQGKKSLFKCPVLLGEDHLFKIVEWMKTSHESELSDLEWKPKLNHLLGTKLKTPRDILQIVGTDVCRTLVNTYHIDIVTRAVKSLPNSKIVITDVRFPNEGNMIVNDLSGFVFKVVGGRSGVKSSINRGHASETAMSDWSKFSGVIDNTKEGLNNLYNEIDRTLERHQLWEDVSKKTMTTQ